MNLNQQVTLTLSKTNLSLMLTLWEASRNQSIQMMNELEKNLEACYQEFEDAAKELLSASDWASVYAGLANMPLLLMKLQTQQLQKIMESWIKAQLRISTDSREAIDSWQRTATTAIQEGAGAMPLSATLRGFFGSQVGPHPQAARSQAPSQSSPVKPRGQLLPINFGAP